MKPEFLARYHFGVTGTKEPPNGMSKKDKARYAAEWERLRHRPRKEKIHFVKFGDAQTKCGRHLGLPYTFERRKATCRSCASSPNDKLCHAEGEDK